MEALGCSITGGGGGISIRTAGIGAGSGDGDGLGDGFGTGDGFGNGLGWVLTPIPSSDPINGKMNRRSKLILEPSCSIIIDSSILRGTARETETRSRAMYQNFIL